MLENFSEEAINIIKLAQEEAKRLEFESINPEHLLLGVIGQKTGYGAQILINLGLDLKTARILIERLIGRGYISLPLEEISFSNDTLKILQRSINICEQRQGKTVKSEDILMALIELEDNTQISLIKKQFSLDLDKIKQEYEILKNKINVDNNILPTNFSIRYVSPTVQNILAKAKELTIKHSHVMISTEQILWSIADTQECLGSKILYKSDLTPDIILTEIYRLFGQGSESNYNNITYTNITQKCLDFAWNEAKKYSYHLIGSGHLLLGLLHYAESPASYIIKHLQKEQEQICLDIITLLNKYPNNPEPEIKDIYKELQEQYFDTILQDKKDKSELEKINI